MISTTQSKKIQNLILFIAGILIIVILISIIGLIKNNEVVFPKATTIMEAFFRLLSTGETYKYIGITILDFSIALLVSSILGLGLGIIAGFNDVFLGIMKPLIMILRSLPMIILIVIFMLTVPNDNYRYVPIISTSLALMPILYEAVSTGIRGIDRYYNDVWRLNSNLNAKVILNVHLPLIKGYLKQAFVNSIGFGIKMIVTTEFVAGVRNTLGTAIFNSKVLIEYADIYAYSLILIIIVLLFEMIPNLVLFIINKYKIKKNEEVKK